jgi:hypothetical protein
MMRMSSITHRWKITAIFLFCVFCSPLTTTASSNNNNNNNAMTLFPPNDEYDAIVLDPNTMFGTPLGGYGRASASRLANTPLTLPPYKEDEYEQDHQQDEDKDKDKGKGTDEQEYPTTNNNYYFQTRDHFGRPLVCRVYSQEELAEDGGLQDGFLEVPVLAGDEESSKSSGAHGYAIQHGALYAVGETGGETQTQTQQEQQQLQQQFSNAPKEQQGEVTPPPQQQSEQQEGKIRADNDANAASDDGDNSDSDSDDDVNRRLAPLEGMCAQFHHGWWSYEWCFRDKIIQFHVHTDVVEVVNSLSDIQFQDITSLGTFDSRSIKFPADYSDDVDDGILDFETLSDGWEERARVTDTFTNGDLCPVTNELRATQVNMGCCSPRIMAQRRGGILYHGKPYATDLLALQFAIEVDVCHYNITVCTPLLCKANAKDDALGTSTSTSTKASTTSSSSTTTQQPKTDLSIRQILDKTFDRQRKTCIQTGNGGWWVYELCPGTFIRQFHEISVMDRMTGAAATKLDEEHILGAYLAADHEVEPDYKSVINVTTTGHTVTNTNTNTNPGNRKGVAKNGNGAYFVQEYTRGDLCDHEDVTDSAIKAGKIAKGAIYRAATIKYSCGTKMTMTVKEDSTCHYIVDVVIPALCEHPLFQAPVFKKQVIKCLPAE